MHLDSTLRRVSRAEGTGIVFILAASLAGCVGSIDTGERSKSSGGGGSNQPPGPIGEAGSTGITGPSACKPDQIGTSPLRRLTKTQYDNSIKDLLGIDLGLSQRFSEDELA